MIRNTMIGLSLFALMTGSALAATPASKHVSKPRTVAAAPAGDAAKEPAKADAPKTEKKGGKKGGKKDKGADKGGDAAKTEMKSAPEPTK
ncbi:MAG TPA: hypothetical protein VKQ32_22250 [Polyangia bacterium]|nr:hypothetical protein [Polyangia bacterium]